MTELLFIPGFYAWDSPPFGCRTEASQMRDEESSSAFFQEP